MSHGNGDILSVHLVIKSSTNRERLHNTILILLGIKILVKESQIPNEIIYINIKFSSNLFFDIFKPFLSII